MVATNKSPLITLFSVKKDIFSHQVRIVLAEKDIKFEYIEIDNLTSNLIDFNQYGTLPTLVDRELKLYKSSIIMEYLDERFPHPPLMPVYPVARGTSRLMMHRIENEWYSLMRNIMKSSGDEAKNYCCKLLEALLVVAPLFNKNKFFMSEEFSLVDCCLAPLLWRLPQLGIELSGKGTKELSSYMRRLFDRETFIASLTDAEREMNLFA